MKIVNIYSAKTNMSKLVEQALAGEEVIISKFNKPLVRLTPIEQSVKPRKIGMFKGKIEIDKGFDLVDRVISDLFYAQE